MNASAPLVVSTTLVSNAPHLIVEAIESVRDWVDLILIIDTGCTDDTIAKAKLAAGEKFRLAKYEWKNDFAAARNFALQEAARLGAHYAVTLDSDERLKWSSALSVKSRLIELDANVFLVFDKSQIYAKERIFKLPLPVDAKWDGEVHEVFPTHPHLKRMLFSEMIFWEVPKSEQALGEKLQRDYYALKRMTASRPEARWPFHLGEVCVTLKKFDEAYAAYEQVVARTNWDEEGAWACFRLAAYESEFGTSQKTLDWCARGIRFHPGFAELYWLAGVVSLNTKNNRDAIYWATLATALSPASTDPLMRIGFRHMPAYFDAPYEVLRQAWRNIGVEERAKQAEQLYYQKLVERP